MKPVGALQMGYKLDKKCMYCDITVGWWSMEWYSTVWWSIILDLLCPVSEYNVCGGGHL